MARYDGSRSAEAGRRSECPAFGRWRIASPIRCQIISLNLESIYFFRDLTKAQHDELSRLMEIVYFPEGGVCFEEDDTGDGMYVLLEGVVQMRKRSGNDEVIATFLQFDAATVRELQAARQRKGAAQRGLIGRASLLFSQR